MSSYTNELANFLNESLGDPSLAWSEQGVACLSRLSVPDALLGRLSKVLKGDVSRQWASWFVSGVCDTERIVREDWNYPRILGHVQKWVADNYFSGIVERKELVLVVARIVHAEVARAKLAGLRRMLPKAERESLVDLEDGTPKCWICGYRFQQAAVDNFLHGANSPLMLPPLVDIYKPIGLRLHDLTIQVDHVVPFAHGGGEGDNLKLACGWCNLHKSSHLSLYDVSGDTRIVPRHINSAGVVSLPQPFWVVRVLALHQHAQHGTAMKDNVELTVAPINPHGALVPTNLAVVGYGENDPVGSERMQPRRQVAAAWRRSC